MFLGSTLTAASSGLSSIENQLAVVSQNVSNASTPNYVEETVPLSSLDTAGGPAGVDTGQATREVNVQQQAQVFAAVGNEAGSNAANTALAGIDQASGAPGSGQDLASLVGNLQDSFSTLANDPSSTSQQLDVINQAQSLASGINSLSATIVQARQNAQSTLSQDVTSANSTLKTLGQLSDQIIAAKAAGQSTASLEDQRDGDMRTLSQLTGAKFIEQQNGDLLAMAGNSVLPLHATSGPFSLANANISGGTSAASVPAMMLDGSPASGLGGDMGANLTLRDVTLPGMQSQLDSFAQSLASSFQAQGMTLFTDGSGNVPTTTTDTGFSGTIQVSAAVQAMPTMVRDGTGATTPGSAGNTSLISSVLTNVFASGATGMTAQASTVVSGIASQASQAASTATTNTSLRTGLDSTLSSQTGVSIDNELSKMITLQNAYAANAKVITAVNNMWTDLMGIIQ